MLWVVRMSLAIYRWHVRIAIAERDRVLQTNTRTFYVVDERKSHKM